jgi:hypothetical protein
MSFIFLLYLKLLIALAIPILAPFILQFKNEKPKVKKSENKIKAISNVGNEADIKLTLEMKELESEKIDDDDGEENFLVDESEKKEIEEDSFELNEPIRNFVTFWTAPIVKFFYFQALNDFL